VLDEAIEGTENRQLAGWPLLLHVLLDPRAIESVPILISHNNLISIEVVHTQLDCDPLIVRKVDKFGRRLVIILACKEMEPGRVAAHHVEHEDVLKLDEVAVLDGLARGSRHTSRLIHLQRH